MGTTRPGLVFWLTSTCEERKLAKKRSTDLAIRPAELHLNLFLARCQSEATSCSLVFLNLVFDGGVWGWGRDKQSTNYCECCSVFFNVAKYVFKKLSYVLQKQDGLPV
jgi:hypothetical protein